jgi:hypothetical protein
MTLNNHFGMKRFWIEILVFILVVPIGLIALKQLTKAKQTPRNSTQVIEFPSSYTIGAYLWTSPDELSPEDVKSLLAFAHKEKINTIYLNIEKYLDILESENKEVKNAQMNKFDDSLALFIQESKNTNISVQALAGNILWANSSHEYIPPLLLKSVFDFNQAHTDTQFDGFQFDIEYYNQPGFSSKRAEYNSDFLSLVDKLVKQTSGEFKLGFAIPYWLDDKNGNYVFNDLAAKLNTAKGTYVTIMAYRNYPDGEDGVINLAKGEIEYVKKNTPNVSVIVAQETDTGEAPKTTFYGKSKQDLKYTVKTIVDYFKSYNNFTGIAIHHLESYKNLKDY